MKFGKPAFAGNIVKLLISYKGDVVSDIGVGFGQKVCDKLLDYSKDHEQDR